MKRTGIREEIRNIIYILKLGWKCDKMMYFYIAVARIFSCLLPFIGILAPKLIIDELMGEKRTEVFITIILAILVISVGLGFISEYCDSRYYPKREYFKMYLKKDLFEKCMTLKFEHTEDPNIMNNLEDSKTAISSWDLGMVHVIDHLFAFFGYLVSFFGYAWIITSLNPLILALLAINIIAVYVIKVKFADKKLEIYHTISPYSRKLGYLEGVMCDFEYGKDTRVFSMKNWLVEKTTRIKKVRIDYHDDYSRTDLPPEYVNCGFMFIREIVIYLYLIYRFSLGSLQIGDFTMYFTTVSKFTNWMIQIVESIVELKVQSSHLNDYRMFLEKGDEEEDCETQDMTKNTQYEIEFCNVTFRYPHGKRDIFKNLSFKIKASEKIAIVGINGAGKTTLVKLLTRLYEPNDGKILINGVDIKTYNKKEYWKIFSVVFQEIIMFAFSVGENVSLNNELDRGKAENCMQLADIWEKISGLKNGMDTSALKMLDKEGISFSGGENQKIAIARALYKDGSVVILDEPTSALDALAENAIYKQFDNMIKGKTAIYISHRLASTRFCDRILFFENGCVVEEGSHESLLELNGEYAKMFEIQSHYYKEGVNLND